MLASLTLTFTPALRAQWTPANGSSAIPTSFAASAAYLFAGTDSGVVRSSDNGDRWERADSGLMQSHVRAMAFANGVVFAGGDSGVFRSTNDGDTWVRVFGGSANMYVYALATGGGAVFAGNDSGVFRSTNDGASWSAVNTGLTNNHVYALLYDHGILFAGTTWGVYRSTNGGAAWTLKNGGFSYVQGLAALHGVVFAATEGNGIFRSTDDGNRWTACKSGIIDSIFFSVGSDSFYIYAGSYNSGTYRSSDGGSTWIGDHTYNSTYAFAAIAGRIFSATAFGITRSTNHGNTWQLVDVNIQPYDPTSGATVSAIVSAGGAIFVGISNGGYGGIYRSMNDCRSWVGPSDDDTAGAVTACCTSGADVFMATITHGVFRSRDTGNTWMPVNTGLRSLDVRSLTTVGGALFAGTGSGLARSTNNGASWMEVGVPDTVTSLVNANGVLCAGGGYRVWHSLDGVEWTTSTALIGYVYGLAALGGDLFAATDRGVLRSTDTGKSWGITGLSDVITPRIVAWDGAVAAWTSTGNGEGELFRSTNMGETWTPFNAGLWWRYVGSLGVAGNELFAGTAGSGLFRRALTTPSGSTVRGPDSLAPVLGRNLFACGQLIDTVSDIPPRDSGGSGLSDVRWLNSQEEFGTFNFDSVVIAQPSTFHAGDARAAIHVNVSDRRYAAHGALRAVDRAGNDTVFFFDYRPDSVVADPRWLAMDAVPPGMAKDTVVKLINPLSRPVRMDSVWALHGGAFRVLSNVGTLPALLDPGDTITLTIHYAPPAKEHDDDTIMVAFDCLARPLMPVSGDNVTRCIQVSNYYDRATFMQTVTTDLHVSNTGTDTLRLLGAEITGPSDGHFTITPMSFPVDLPPGTYDYPIGVNFYAWNPTVHFVSSVRVLSNANCTYGDSIGEFDVQVYPTTGVATNDMPAHFRLQAFPNPFVTSTRFSIDMPGADRSTATLRVYDMLGRQVADLTTSLRGSSRDVELQADELDACRNGGVMTCVLSTRHGREATRVMFVR